MPRLKIKNYFLHRSKALQTLVKPKVEPMFPHHDLEMESASANEARLKGKVVKVPFDLAIGQIVPFENELHKIHNEQKIVNVTIHKLCLNKFIFKYYYQRQSFIATRENLPTKIGDIVLVEKTDQPPAFNAVLRVKKILYPVGKIIDPFTGLPCEGKDFNLEVLQKWLEPQSMKDSLLIPKSEDSEPPESEKLESKH